MPIQYQDQKMILNSELTEAEQKVIFLIRNIRPYERIEIKLNDNQKGEISVVSTSTIKEIFSL